MSGTNIGEPRLSHGRRGRRQLGAVLVIAVLSGLGFTGTPSVAANPTGGLLATVAPVRLLDTRNTTKLTVGSTRRLVIGGLGGIPVDAKAVALNVTGVSPTESTYLTVWPTGGTFPSTSSLNVDAGTVRPNAVIVGLGTGGAIDIFNAFGNVDVLVDVTAWFSAGDLAPGGLEPIQPIRAMDSRSLSAAGKIGPAASQLQRTVKVTGAGGVPETGVAAVVLNVTATSPTAISYLTVWPNGSSKPGVSSVNFNQGETAANQVIVPVAADGNILVSNEFGSTHFIVDVMGWISSGTVGSGGFVPVAPTRVADTRGGAGLRGRGWLPIRTSGAAIPTTGVAAVAANFTVIGASASSYVSTFATGAGFSTPTFVPKVSLPNSSTLNVNAGQTIPNAAIAAVGPEASIWVYNYEGTANLAVDVSGYWVGVTPAGSTPPTPAAGPGAGGYERIKFTNGATTYWDTCSDIVIKIDPTGGSNFGLDDALSAIARVRSATGLPIVYGGIGSANSAEDLPLRNVLIRWRSSSQDPGLSGSTLAYASSLGFRDGEVAVGLISVRTDFPGQLGAGFGPGETWGAVLVHELGHIFGLAHTTDFSQIMYPSIQRATGEYRAGDLTGLSLVKRDGCFLKGDRGPLIEQIIVD